jgi:hypothetical protein
MLGIEISFSREGRLGTRTIRISSGVENHATIVSAASTVSHDMSLHCENNHRAWGGLKAVSEADDADDTDDTGATAAGLSADFGHDESDLDAAHELFRESGAIPRRSGSAGRPPFTHSLPNASPKLRYLGL